MQRDALARRERDDALRRLEVVVAQRPADVDALRGEQRVGHAAADHERVDALPAGSRTRRSCLPTFAPPIAQTNGWAGSSVSRAERGQLGLHQQARVRRQVGARRLGRGVRAVRGGEGVVDVEVAAARELRARTPGRCASSSGWKRTFSSSANVAVAQVARRRAAQSSPTQSVGELHRRRRAARPARRRPGAASTSGRACRRAGRGARGRRSARPARAASAASAARRRCASRRRSRRPSSER